MDVHFKDKFDGPDNYCGIEIEYDTEKPEYLVGISILGAISINLTPGQWTNVNMGCEFDRSTDFEVFALRTHAHNQGCDEIIFYESLSENIDSNETL